MQPDAKAQSAARPVASVAENKPVASKPAESKPSDIKAAAQSADTRAAVNPKAAEFVRTGDWIAPFQVHAKLFGCAESGSATAKLT